VKKMMDGAPCQVFLLVTGDQQTDSTPWAVTKPLQR
jgi:hypothetical protein